MDVPDLLERGLQVVDGALRQDEELEAFASVEGTEN